MVQPKGFKEQLVFQPVSGNQGFQPLQAPDTTPQLRRNQQAQLNEMQIHAKARMDDMRTQQQILESKKLVEDLQMKQLLGLTEAGTEFLTKAGEVWNEHEEAAGTSIFFEDLAAREAARSEYLQNESQLSALDSASEELALDAQKKGAPFHVTSRYGDLWGRRKRGYEIAAAKHYGLNYNTHVQQQLQSDRVISLPDGKQLALNKPNKTNREYAAARAFIREEYMQLTGMHVMDKGVLAEHAFPEMQKQDARLSAQHQKQQADEQSFMRETEAFGHFADTHATDPLAFSHLLNTLATNTKDGVAIGMRGAWKKVRTVLVEMSDNGQDITPLLASAARQVIPGDPKNRTYGELYGRQLDSIYDDALEQDRKNWTDQRNTAQMQYTDLRDKGIQQLGEDASLGDIEALEKNLTEFAQQNGIYTGPDQVIANLKNDPYVSGDAARYAAAVSDLQMKQALGILKVADVEQYGPRIRERFMPIAINQENSWKKVGGLESKTKRLTQYIKGQPGINLLPDQSMGEAALGVAEHYEKLMLLRTQELIRIGTDPDTAADQAYNEFQIQFDKDKVNPASRFYIDPNGKGFNNFHDRTATIDNTRVLNANLRHINSVAQAMPNKYLDSPGLFGNEEYFQNIKDNYGKPGFTIPQEIVRWALYHRKSPLEIINRQMEALGLGTLPNTEQVLEQRKNATPEYRRFLDNLFSGVATQNQFNRFSGVELPVRSSVAQYVPDRPVSRVRAAIISQESGGDYHVVNPHSGAIGLGQVMPENVGPWTLKHLGRAMSPSEFRYNRAAQDAVIDGQFREMYQRYAIPGRSEEQIIRMIAAEWYGGPGAVQHWNNPRYGGGYGGQYPNMQQYTAKIWQRYRGS